MVPERARRMIVEDNFELAPCGLAVLSPGGVVLKANRAFCRWIGCAEPKRVRGRNFADLIEGEGAAFFAELAVALARAPELDDVFVLLRGESGQVRPAYVNFVLRRDEAGAPASIHIAATRGESRAFHEAELERGKRAAEQLAAIVSTSADAIVSVDPQGRVLNANRAFSEIFQYEPAEIAGANLADLIVPEECRADYEGKLASAALGATKAQIVRRRRKDGAVLDLSLSTAPIRDDSGDLAAVSMIYRDIAPLTRAAEHIEFLLREVNHRSKNLLAVVQAVARQTARLSADPDAFIDRFMSRLSAIGCSHDLLVSRDWRGVRIADLTRNQFSQLDDQARERIEISGDLLEINPRAAESYGLALHELSTNAVKHGALSAPAGKVDLSFHLDRDGKFYTLSWSESGGPPVTAPERSGFGGTVLTRMAPLAIQGESVLDFTPEGLRYRLSAPVAEIVMG
ncbi:PAS domain S-box protein [Rhodoblastus acidophilus]|uniref:Blue-light-activated histidine kinase n=1 Tax=Candidatus Rhodoblastus alkanivorans TaxID=2954117 RepID=A0ABS9Z4N5_9HYPH|nr:PAS domain S-box protein [Candidatus Rhodoblastus alkanivorans]MCI4679952.1 PAS domain S-box protein [Candidatus Rhodoblastus alkanivorans]MCI4682335.1 PAS domain S-box protein [Candidatus Rhodoblastus alkanivorans]MDI4639638.1 PAS domain S-box protein [Rhodoblastus acidophilus]